MSHLFWFDHEHLKRFQNLFPKPRGVVRSDTLAEPVRRTRRLWRHHQGGDVNLRRAMCQAATVMMNRGRSTWLRTWGARVAQRRGRKRAMVALARRIAVILHRIWVDGTVFHPDVAPRTT